MTIETIEKNLALLREQFGYEVEKLENQLAALKKPAEVQYRPAEWPRDAGRTDAEFGNGEGCRWSGPWTLIGFNPTASDFFGSWLANQQGSVVSSVACRVPLLPGETPGYREPVLPADAGKPCEFSDDGVTWHAGELRGWGKANPDDARAWETSIGWMPHARIATGQA